jgi:PAS domain S-box-containing protein
VSERTTPTSTLPVEAQRLLDALLESPIDALMVVDERGEIRMVNAQMTALFGYERDELLGMLLEALLPERFRGRHGDHLDAYLRDPQPRPMGIGLELFALHRDGREIPVEIALTPLESGDRMLIAAAVRDVSRLQRVERALRESQLRMALHVHNTPLAVIEWDAANSTVTAWNPAAEGLFGYRADEVVGRLTANEVLPQGVWEAPMLDPEEPVQPVRSLRRTATRDGRELVCEWYRTPLVDDAGEVVGMAALALDVTARQRALETLLNAQEEERGRIARDLHDQVGQALTGLMMGLTRAGNDPAPERLEGLRATVEETLEEVRRISRDLRPALLDELGLEAAIRRFARELTQGRPFEIDLLVRTPEPLARNEQIVVYRVVQEALTNVARHAEAGSASVVITRRGAEVQLVIEDDGRGFDPAAVPLGVSFGLAGMRERLELLGGNLDIHSSAGAGTILTGRFPARDGDAGGR